MFKCEAQIRHANFQNVGQPTLFLRIGEPPHRTESRTGQRPFSHVSEWANRTMLNRDSSELVYNFEFAVGQRLADRPPSNTDLGQLCPIRGPRPCRRFLCCAYTIVMTSWPYFDDLIFEVFDMQYSSVPLYHIWIACRQISMCPLRRKTHFYVPGLHPFCSICTKLSSNLWFHWHFQTRLWHHSYGVIRGAIKSLSLLIEVP